MKNKSLAVVASSNLSKKYLMCVEPFIKFWLSVHLPHHKIRPVVYLIADRIPGHLVSYEKYIELCTPSSTDIMSALLAQISRLILPSLLDVDYVLTTDIDMLPLSQRLTRTGIKELDLFPESMVVLRDVLPPGEYPICYNLASPSTFGHFFSIPRSFVETPVSKRGPAFGGAILEQYAFDLISKYAADEGYSGIHGGAGWNIDQRFLWDQLSPHVSEGRVRLLDDTATGHRRLDRGKHVWPLNWLVLPLALMGRYTDYHIHHPIWKNRRYMNFLYLGRLFVKRVKFWIQ